MFTGLFASDKAPFILTLTLAILSWFISNIVSNLADVTVVSIAATQRGKDVSYEIANDSLKQSVTNATFKFVCRTKDCFQPLSEAGGTRDFAELRPLPPYAIQGSTTCGPNENGITVRVSLPPGAKIQVAARPTKRSDVDVIFTGIATDNCPDSSSRLAPANMWIYTGCSITLLAIRYYFQILVSLFLVTLAFLVYLLFRRSTPAGQEPARSSEPMKPSK